MYCCLISFFRLSICSLVAKIEPNKIVRWCRNGDFWRFFASCISSETRAVKRVKAGCYQEGADQFEPRLQEEGVVPGEYFLFLQNKTRHILLSGQCKVHHATCRRFDTIPVCVRRTYGRTDRQTDGTVVAITTLAMRALRRDAKTC